MFKVVELGVEFVIVSFILSELEKFSLKLRNNEILLVRFDLSGVEVLIEMRLAARKGWITFLYEEVMTWSFMNKRLFLTNLFYNYSSYLKFFWRQFSQIKTSLYSYIISFRFAIFSRGVNSSFSKVKAKKTLSTIWENKQQQIKTLFLFWRIKYSWWPHLRKEKWYC